MPRGNNTIPLTQIANEFSDFIASQLDDYSKELNTNIEKTLKEVAHEFQKDLEPEIPKSDDDTGKYGHLVENLNTKEERVNGRKRYAVNFGKKGWLSTLLEYGWTLRNGKILPRTPIIRPVFARNKERYFKKIRDDINEQNGR